jgi:hypothetical protein
MSEAEKESVKCVYCRCSGAFRRHGNLAYKKNFPSLQAMVKSGRLEVPVIWVEERFLALRSK